MGNEDLRIGRVEFAVVPRPIPTLESAGEEELYSHLEASDSLEQYIERIRTLLHRIGITDFAHTNLYHFLDVLDPIGTHDITFIDRYGKEGFPQDDLVIQALLIQKIPLFRSTVNDIVRNAPFELESFNRHKEICGFLEQHGIFDSYNIPMIDGAYSALFTLSSDQCDPLVFKEIVTKNITAIHRLAAVADRVGRTVFAKQFHRKRGSQRIPLLPRHRQLLEVLVHKDVTLNEAAEILNIKISTANQHIAAAKRRLSAYTTHGLLVAAYRAGLISLK
jgi:DNA-binding CsgD family transcriptional regulator